MQQGNTISAWTAALEAIQNGQAQLPVLSLDTLSPANTVLVVMDMVGGFVEKGPLASPRVKAIQAGIARLQRQCAAHRIPRLAFADSHDQNCPEFSVFPAHCVRGTAEAEITAEILNAGVEQIIEKNSTNGFLEPAFQHWLAAHAQTDTFLLTGDCTDLCVMQFALALKADFNRRNQHCRVIVPTALVETYDLGEHNAGLMNTLALYQMRLGGVELVSNIVD